jgi:hypothetical protein
MLRIRRAQDYDGSVVAGNTDPAAAANAVGIYALAQHVCDTDGKCIQPSELDASDSTWRLAAKTFLLGNVVLEGVAGVGKTYELDVLCSLLARQHANHGHGLDPKKIEDSLRSVVTVCKEQVTKGFGSFDGEAVRTAMRDLHPAKPKVTLLVMHPSTSYEGSIVGLRPRGKDFVWEVGALAEAILAAQDDFAKGNDHTCHVLVLDEINRCNLPTVLGELMLVMDSTRRMTKALFRSEFRKLADPPGVGSALRRGYAAQIPNLSAAKRPSNKPAHDLLWLPSNLYVIGTMNSSDRSILGFDQAMRRRFPPQRIEPMSFKELLTYARIAVPAHAEAIKDELFSWAVINALLLTQVGPDAMIGHSYLLTAINQLSNGGDLESVFSLAWEGGILPQVVHAAESSREEKFAARVFERKKLADKKDPFVKELSRNLGTVLGTGCDATALDGLAENVCSGSKPAGRSSGMRTHTLLFTGRNHGARLLIAGIDKNILKEIRDDAAERQVMITSYCQ